MSIQSPQAIAPFAADPKIEAIRLMTEEVFQSPTTLDFDESDDQIVLRISLPADAEPRQVAALHGVWHDRLMALAPEELGRVVPQVRFPQPEIPESKLQIDVEKLRQMAETHFQAPVAVEHDAEDDQTVLAIRLPLTADPRHVAELHDAWYGQLFRVAPEVIGNVRLSVVFV